MRSSTLEKNIPDLQKMAVGYMPLGTQEELRQQIIDVALDRAFLLDPLPADEAAVQARLDEGRGRLTLIANEVARLAGTILAEYAAAVRKIKDTKIQPEATQDAAQQLQKLVPKRFLADTPWAALQHLPRYLKAIVLRLDKLRADPARDAARMAEVRPRSSATGAWWPSARATSTTACRTSAGCWRNCGSACSRRNCARRSR
jgi:ATP-dependent helicase HrpA